MFLIFGATCSILSGTHSSDCSSTVSCFNSSDKTEAVKVEATGMAGLVFKIRVIVTEAKAVVEYAGGTSNNYI